MGWSVREAGEALIPWNNQLRLRELRTCPLLAPVSECREWKMSPGLSGYKIRSLCDFKEPGTLGLESGFSACYLFPHLWNRYLISSYHKRRSRPVSTGDLCPILSVCYCPCSCSGRVTIDLQAQESGPLNLTLLCLLAISASIFPGVQRVFIPISTPNRFLQHTEVRLYKGLK